MTDIEHAAQIADHGRADEAALILETLLQTEPGCASARRVLGKIYIDLKRFEDPVCILEENPDDTAARSLLGTAWMKKGDSIAPASSLKSCC